MAQLGNLLVTGAAKFLNNIYVNKSVTAPTFIGNLQGQADSAASIDWSGIRNYALSHNVPRLVGKDLTKYYNDGTLWQRLNGTNGFSRFEDIYVGDYFQMSRPISAKNPDSTQQLTGSQWVTIISINGLMRNGNENSSDINFPHLVMAPGKGINSGVYHFGRSRMNATNTTVGGYKNSELNTVVIGEVVTEGSTAEDATINQQLYAEFGSHLKTTKELVSNSINATGNNRLGTNSGCANNWEWIDAQAILMSEVEVYGATVWSSSGYDTGNANHQFELFKYNKSAINNRSAWHWLKDVVSASHFCYCHYNGSSYYAAASYSWGCVRPRFVLGA